MCARTQIHISKKSFFLQLLSKFSSKFIYTYVRICVCIYICICNTFNFSDSVAGLHVYRWKTVHQLLIWPSNDASLVSFFSILFRYSFPLVGLNTLRNGVRKNCVVCKNLRECRSFEMTERYDCKEVIQWDRIIEKKKERREKCVFVRKNRAKWRKEELITFSVESEDSVCSNYIETVSVITLKIERDNMSNLYVRTT